MKRKNLADAQVDAFKNRVAETSLSEPTLSHRLQKTCGAYAEPLLSQLLHDSDPFLDWRFSGTAAADCLVDLAPICTRLKNEREDGVFAIKVTLDALSLKSIDSGFKLVVERCHVYLHVTVSSGRDGIDGVDVARMLGEQSQVSRLYLTGDIKNTASLLTEILHSPALTHLSIGGFATDPFKRHLKLLGDAVQSVTHLSFTNTPLIPLDSEIPRACDLSTDSFEAIFEAVGRNPYLQFLQIRGCANIVKTPAFEQLITVLGQHPSLHSLDLSGMHMGRTPGRIGLLINTLRVRYTRSDGKLALKLLDLSSNSIGTAEARQILHALTSGLAIRSLSVAYNRIGDRVASQLLAIHGLNSLNMAGNLLTHLDLPQDSSLRFLCVSENRLKGDNFNLLAHWSTQRAHLRILLAERVGAHIIHDSSWQALTHLSLLNLGSNDIATHSLTYLTDRLTEHQCRLEQLYLCDIGLTQQGLDYFAETLPQNSRLKVLDLRDNAVLEDSASGWSKFWPWARKKQLRTAQMEAFRRVQSAETAADILTDRFVKESPMYRLYAIIFKKSRKQILDPMLTPSWESFIQVLWSYEVDF